MNQNNKTMAKSVKHSGHLGDVIYSLSFVKQMNERVDYYIGFDRISTIANHPSGKYTMNESSYAYILPLLEHQEYIGEVYKHRNQNIDYDLDIFRDKGFSLGAYDLRKWYELVYPLTSVDIGEPAIHCDLPFLEYLNDKIVINLSLRYRNQQIDYSKLKEYESQIVFVGLENEYTHFQAFSKLNVKKLHVKDALHMAQIIKSCKLFIGNQSSSFAIAEQMKTPRALELYNDSPNVIVTNNGIAYTNTETLINHIKSIL